VAPPPIKNNDPNILGGYPENRPTQDAGSAPAVAFVWIRTAGAGLKAKVSTKSGAQRCERWPLLLMLPREDRVELAGFVYEAHTEYEIVRVRQASLIGRDGALVAPPPGARPFRG
jgi:hypothetical protein